MNAWRNLKIGVRLAAGIGTVLTLLVIVAAAAYVGLNSGNANFGDYRAMARQTAAAIQSCRRSRMWTAARKRCSLSSTRPWCMATRAS